METPAGQPDGRARAKNALVGAAPSGIGEAWRRVPHRIRSLLPLVIVLLVAVIYPSIVDSLRGLAVIGDFFPQVSSVVIILVFTMMAVGLNIVVGYAGLLDLGYVAFYAAGALYGGLVRLGPVRAGELSPRLGRNRPGGDRHPCLALARPHHGRDLHRVHRDPDRAPDAPPPGRLPGDRDARIRRDHPTVRSKRRQHQGLRPDERHVRDQPDRLARLRRRAERVARLAARLPGVVRPREAVLFHHPRAPSDHGLLQRQAQGLPPRARPGSRSGRTRRPPRRWASR